MYQTLDQFKAACKFFPKGRIVPQHVLKGAKKLKHKVTFGSDCWLLYTPKGHFFFADTKSGGTDSCFIRIMITEKAHLTWHPYIPNVNTRWVINRGRATLNHDYKPGYPDEEMIEIINRNLK